jgi:hypothetical protein
MLTLADIIGCNDDIVMARKWRSVDRAQIDNDRYRGGA